MGFPFCLGKERNLREKGKAMMASYSYLYRFGTFPIDDVVNIKIEWLQVQAASPSLIVL